MIYKGYVRTKNKESLEKIKGVSKFRSLEQVEDMNEYAGVLEDDIVLIDIDDFHDSEILMNIVEEKQLNCRVIETTRGKHFLFKNNSYFRGNHNNKKLAIGIQADIKIGTKNSYQVLKYDGKERFVIWEEHDELDPAPRWLSPVDSKVDFGDLGEGDGRNNALYSYVLNLTTSGLAKDDVRETISLINYYVLAKPREEKELEVILRDEAFPKKVFFNGRTFLHNNFALFLKNNNRIIRVNGMMYAYKDGTYVNGYREIESAMIEYIPSLKASQRVEVLKYLDIIVEDVEESEARYISFKNGIYDLVENKLIPHTPDIILTNQIPWNYNESAYHELTDVTLNKIACGDGSIRKLLEEAVGYCFYRRNELSKAFILTGDRQNGKSTFLDMVKNALGEDNYVALDMSELDERFSVASLAGKLANIGDDISDDFMRGKSVSLFKKIVSGNKIKGEFKGEDTFFFSPYVKLLFSANDIPRIRDRTGAVMRRLIIVPFNARFSPSDPDFDPYIRYKLMAEEAMEYLIKLGLEGLSRVLSQKKFSLSEKAEEQLDRYEFENNPILQFLDTFPDEQIINQDTKLVHRAYRVFCAENGYQEMNLGNFTKELRRHVNVKTKRLRIDGKLITQYVEENS